VPITVEYDSKRGWLVAQIAGTLNRDEMLAFLQTARASTERRMTPLLVDARGATTDMTDDDLDRAVAVVDAAARHTGLRGHVAIVSDDDCLFDWMLRYETKCAEVGVRIIRVFRQAGDAERWLEAVAAVRNFR
jgi:hypothetical protein